MKLKYIKIQKRNIYNFYILSILKINFIISNFLYKFISKKELDIKISEKF